MDKTELVKQDIMVIVYQTYGEMVGTTFKIERGKEVLPIFVQYAYIVLKQNMGKFKAAEQLDSILSKYGISVSSYEE